MFARRFDTAGAPAVSPMTLTMTMTTWRSEDPEETKSDDSGLKPGETRVALQKINLSIFPGERVGFIGANGSGKSTLLSIVSGMSHPTSGTVVGRGSLIHLSEITKPFNPSWSGLRNLRVLAQFLGFPPELIEERAARIARFAGMEDSILAAGGDLLQEHVCPSCFCGCA